MSNANTNFEELKIDAFTTPCPVCVTPRTTVSEIMHLMETEGVRHIPVTEDNEKLVGVISQRDLNAIKAFKFYDTLYAGDVMVSDPETAQSGTLLSEAVFRMSEEKIGSLMVLDPQGRLEGIFTSTDALNALIEVLRGDVLDS